MTRRAFAIGTFATAVLGSPTVKPVFPGKTWEEAAPEDAGMNPEKLAKIAFGASGCVVRYGHMVHKWGNQDRLSAGGSEVKPYFTHFLFKAVEEGRLPSVDAKVMDFEPRLKDLNPQLGYKDRQITWAQMARQISCYGVEERPGTAFDYNDFNMALFGDTLLLNVYRAGSWKEVTEKVVHPKLSEPMQWEDRQEYDENGRLRMSARDHCRFGLLYLRKGKWKNQQLLAAEHVHKILGSSLPGTFPRTQGHPADLIPGQRRMGNFNGGINQTDHHGSYSFAWWMNGMTREGKRRLPDAPSNLHGCEGGSAEVFTGMFVFPTQELIVAWRNAPRGEDSHVTVNGFFRQVLDSVRGDRE